MVCGTRLDSYCRHKSNDFSNFIFNLLPFFACQGAQSYAKWKKFFSYNQQFLDIIERNCQKKSQRKSSKFLNVIKTNHERQKFSFSGSFGADRRTTMIMMTQMKEFHSHSATALRQK